MTASRAGPTAAGTGRGGRLRGRWGGAPAPLVAAAELLLLLLLEPQAAIAAAAIETATRPDQPAISFRDHFVSSVKVL